MKNHISKDAEHLLRTEILYGLFPHQRGWLQAEGEPTRFVVNARMVGATTYFALEGLMRALSNDEHQVFLSPSKRLSAVTREVIKRRVAQVAQVKLVGEDEITLSNGVVLSFCGPMDVFRAVDRIERDGCWNAELWESVYVDDPFWIRDFERLNKAICKLAPSGRCRRTYFGPFSDVPKQSQAWQLWSADAAEKGGRVGADGVWRQIVTAEDVDAGGFGIYDIEVLKAAYTAEEFARLYLCDAGGAA